jgi:LysR family carnitine catabolism transcriptional activator
MNVSIRQLRAFVAVARAGSFAEASAILHLSQPALSIAIRKLEEELGGTLFARSTRSVGLSPEGQAFFPVARQLLADWDRSLEDVSNLFALRRGKLNIAAMPTFAGSVLPEILADFHGQYPAIDVTVHDVVAESVVEMVRNGRAELGLTFDPGEFPDLEFRPLFEDRFMAAIPEGHPLQDQDIVRWKDLEGTTFLCLQRPSAIRQMIDEVVQEHELALVPTFETHQLGNIGRMVATGLGLSVVPSLSAPQFREMGVSCRSLVGPVISRAVGVLSRRRHPLSVAAQALETVVFDWVRLSFRSTDNVDQNQ